jgi:hypothetical protein
VAGVAQGVVAARVEVLEAEVGEDLGGRFEQLDVGVAGRPVEHQAQQRPPGAVERDLGHAPAADREVGRWQPSAAGGAGVRAGALGDPEPRYHADPAFIDPDASYGRRFGWRRSRRHVLGG